MKRKDFITAAMLATPALALGHVTKTGTPSTPSATEPFVVPAGKSRFGNDTKFMGVHPNDLKISSKDTSGHLAVFEYTGYAKIGPPLHIHHQQDEIFTVITGKYRFQAGDKIFELGPGETIFLPRGVAHTWIQLSDEGKLIYFLQPAGKMEEFFIAMNNLKEPPTPELLDKIHAEHAMKIVGPSLSL